MMKEIDEITGEIISAAIKIHSKLGPGLFESVYEEVLFYELTVRGLVCENQMYLPVIYENVKMDVGFRIDLLVEKQVLVEIKSIETIHPVHKKQLLTYLRLMDLKIGLLLNFNEELLKKGITRLINNYAI
jgi:GxxExxY protein